MGGNRFGDGLGDGEVEVWEFVRGGLGGRFPLLYDLGRVFCFDILLFGAFFLPTLFGPLTGSGASFPCSTQAGCGPYPS